MAKDVIVRIRADKEDFERGINGARKSVMDFDKMIKNSVASMTKLVASVATVQTAMSAAKKYIDSSQTATDSWNRTMAAATGSVDAFFESLSQGNFDSFITGLDGIITKAKEAYDAIDALGSLNIIADYRKQLLRTEQADLRDKIRSGVGDTEAYKKRLRETQSEMDAIIAEQGRMTYDAAIATLKSYTGANDRQVKMLLDIIQKNPNLLSQDVALQMAKELEKKNPYLAEGKISLSDFGSSVAIARKTFQVGRNIILTDAEARSDYNVLTRFGQMSDPRLIEAIGLLTKSSALAESNSQRRVSQNEDLNYGGKTSGISGTMKNSVPKPELPDFDTPAEVLRLRFNKTRSRAELKQELTEWQQRLEEATSSTQAIKAEEMVSYLQSLLDAQPLALRVDMSEEDVARIQKTLKTTSENIRAAIAPIEFTPGSELMFKPLEQADKTVKDISGSVSSTVNAFGNLGTVMQSLEDPSAQVAGLVMQAVANVAATFAKSLAGTVTPWDWIAAALAGTATMTSTIAAIKSATSGAYADGGIIPGNIRMGDAIPVMANAGELILNAAQQQNLVSQLEPRHDSSPGTGRSTISGEQIVTVVNAYGRRTGRGEILV